MRLLSLSLCVVMIASAVVQAVGFPGKFRWTPWGLAFLGFKSGNQSAGVRGQWALARRTRLAASCLSGSES
jgi:hypothetical protein